MHSQTLLDNTEGNDFSTCGKTEGTHGEQRGSVCSSSKVSSVQGYKNLNDWIQYLCSNVADCLFEATSQ